MECQGKGVITEQGSLGGHPGCEEECGVASSFGSYRLTPRGH